MPCRSFQSVAFVCLLLGLLVLPACKSKVVRLQLPGFGSAAIEGVSFWVESGTGPGGQPTYEEACRIDFLNVTNSGNIQRLNYRQSCSAPGLDPLLIPFQVEIDRPVGNSDVVIVTLWYTTFRPPSTYRIRAFNAVGQSRLSQASFVF